MSRRSGIRVSSVVACGLAMAVNFPTRVLRAQTPPGPAGEAGAAVGGPSTGPSAAASPLSPGWRLGAGQAPVVGGNAAGARERALNEAFKQAVDQALSSFLEPARRTADSRTVNQVLGRPRAYVSRYRTLEDGEAGAVYRVRLEAEIDENALQRAFVRSAPASAAGRGAGASGFLVASALRPEEAAALTSALKKLGLRAETASPEVASAGSLPPLVEATAKASFLAAVSVIASTTDDGVVRGAGVWSTSCRLHGRVISAPAGEAIADLEASDRGFGANAAAAKTACLNVVSESLASQLAPYGEGPSDASSVRPLVVEVTTRDAGALPQLVKMLRNVAAVSGAEIRRISGGRADLWVRTSLTPGALLAALEKERSAGLQITAVPGGDAGDRLRIGVQVEAAAAAGTEAPTTSPSPPSPRTTP